MSRYSSGTTKTGPVTAVVSGNRPLTTMQAMDKRFAFYDGRSGDLTSGKPAALMPLVSENWTKLFTWQGVGPMPESERAKLHAYVEAAHAAGYRVRFWATPDQPGPARPGTPCGTSSSRPAWTTSTPTTSLPSTSSSAPKISRRYSRRRLG